METRTKTGCADTALVGRIDSTLDKALDRLNEKLEGKSEGDGRLLTLHECLQTVDCLTKLKIALEYDDSQNSSRSTQ